jgi:glycosyltransferase 2 family protein
MRELSLAGPIVQTIFVWRKSRRSWGTMGRSLAFGTPACQLRSVSEERSSEGPPTPSLGRGVVAALLGAIAVFAALSVAGDVRALGYSLTQFRFSALLIALGLVLGNYALRFLRWQYYLKTLGLRVDIGFSALVFLAGFIMSVTPGKMGEVLKSFLLNEYRGISISRTASGVVAERLLDLVALVFLVSLASVRFPSGLLVAALGALLVLAIVLVCTVRPLGEFVLAQLPGRGPLGRLTPRLREAYGALQELTRAGPFAVGASYATLGWSLECLATWYVVRGFDEGAMMSVAGASFSYAAGTLAGALAMLPGGLGVAEIGMSSLFRVADPSISLATAAAATILVRLCTLWFGVAVGGCALFLLRVSADKQVVQREK